MCPATAPVISEVGAIENICIDLRSGTELLGRGVALVGRKGTHDGSIF
jgi:hypothetical protein